MLLNQLYTYKHLEGDSISFLKFKINIRGEHEIFKGHFPDNPVTPGVCQMEIVKEILADHIGEEIFFRSVTDMKFINLWVPLESELVYLDIAASEFEKGYKIKAVIYTDNKTYFKLRGIVNGSF